MEILKFLKEFADRVRIAKEVAIARATIDRQPPPFLTGYPVYVCEYTNKRMSPVTRIEIDEGKIVIYGESDGWYADTRWNVEDVMAHVDSQDKVITEDQAKVFLEENDRYIVDAMVTAGFEAIDQLLDFSELPDKPKEEEELMTTKEVGDLVTSYP